MVNVVVGSLRVALPTHEYDLSSGVEEDSGAIASSCLLEWPVRCEMRQVLQWGKQGR